MVLIVLTPLTYSYSEEKIGSYLSIKILIGFTGPFSVQKAGKENSRSDFSICQDCAYKMVFLLEISAQFSAFPVLSAAMLTCLVNWKESFQCCSSFSKKKSWQKIVNMAFICLSITSFLRTVIQSSFYCATCKFSEEESPHNKILLGVEPDEELACSLLKCDGCNQRNASSKLHLSKMLEETFSEVLNGVRKLFSYHEELTWNIFGLLDLYIRHYYPPYTLGQSSIK